MSRSIYISAGHSNKSGRDRGASGNGYIEGELAVELRNLIVSELRKLGKNPIVDADDSILSQTINFFRNKTTNRCIVVDIHWNAAGPTATGTETLIPSDNTKFERDLAKACSDVISETLGIVLRGNHAGLRGVKTELESRYGRLGFMRLTGENILLEVCFITNSGDMTRYQRYKRTLAERLANVLAEFSDDEVKTGDNIHIVSSGETLWSISRRYNITVDALVRLNNLKTNGISVGQRLRIR